MINLKNIRSLTDFRRNASHYIEQIRETQAPLVLTINGEAAVIVQDARSFQQLQDRLERAEQELQSLKRDALRQDIAAGLAELEAGEYDEYDQDTLSDLFDDIKASGRRRLAKHVTV
jgi:prevent-host-death family protein